MPSSPSQKLIHWYQSQQRSLPWRENPEPYAVWIAEIMAQQTRLESMLPYYERWMQRYPTVQALSAADIQDLLKLWEGLGYYNRARNLHRAAQIIVADHAGQLPKTLASLRALPGIGPYTAGAIASVAFGLDEPAVDGNAIRVLSRWRNIELDAASAVGRQTIWSAARELLPPGQASDFNQALMDLGAQICLPRNPKCDDCPLAQHCQAQQLGIQELRPVKAKGKSIPTRFFASFLLQRGTSCRLIQRPEQGLLAGMWEFPNLEISAKSSLVEIKQLFRTQRGIQISKLIELIHIAHTYSHFHAEVRLFKATLPASIAERSSSQPGQWVEQADLDSLPMGKIDREIAKTIQNDLG